MYESERNRACRVCVVCVCVCLSYVVCVCLCMSFETERTCAFGRVYELVSLCLRS